MKTILMKKNTNTIGAVKKLPRRAENQTENLGAKNADYNY
jgi:hypothetical protein